MTPLWITHCQINVSLTSLILLMRCTPTLNILMMVPLCMCPLLLMISGLMRENAVRKNLSLPRNMLRPKIVGDLRRRPHQSQSLLELQLLCLLWALVSLMVPLCPTMTLLSSLTLMTTTQLSLLLQTIPLLQKFSVIGNFLGKMRELRLEVNAGAKGCCKGETQDPCTLSLEWCSNPLFSQRNHAPMP